MNRFEYRDLSMLARLPAVERDVWEHLIPLGYDFAFDDDDRFCGQLNASMPRLIHYHLNAAGFHRSFGLTYEAAKHIRDARIIRLYYQRNKK